MKLLRTVRTCALLPLAMAALACDSTGTDFRDDLENQLRAREAFWNQNGSASYTVRIERVCNCPDVYDVRLTVVDSVKTSGTHIFSGDPLTAAELADQITLPEFFALVRDVLNREVPQVSVSYNPDYGFVQFLYIDFDFTKLDDDVQFTVSEYVPATGG